MDNLVTKDLSKYLTNFLYLVKSLDELLEFAILIISSRLLLNSYPSNAYNKPLYISIE